MDKSIKFIYFDLGGVLVDHWIGLKKLADKLGLDRELVKQVFVDHIKQVDSGQLSWREFEQIFYGLLNPSQKFTEPLLHIFVEGIPAISETSQLASDLKTEYKIGILSDISREAYDRVAFKKIVPQIKLDAEIISSEIGSLKPEPKIFEYATKTAGVIAAEILFIDDSERNVEGAINFGWQAILFDRLNPEESVKRIRDFLSQ